jgi:hypothetical protein
MSTNPVRLSLRVLFREKRPGVWIAQAIDHDINAQGKTLEHARHAFAATIAGQVLLDFEAGRTPLSAVGKPPPEAIEGYGEGWAVEPQELTIPPGILPPPWVIAAELRDARVFSG